MEASERALLGGSMFIMGVEDEEQEDRFEKASLDYSILSIIESIGNNNFKLVYWNEINNITDKDLSIQRMFCNRILSRVFEVYNDFSFDNISLDSIVDINNVYSFIEFLEFDCLDFITSVWQFFDIDLRKINLDEFCKLHSNEIIHEIIEQTKVYVLSRMTRDFLRTYNRDDLTNWFSDRSKRMKMDIILNIERRKI
jgi:hypothetical protein